jgi:hypothetical protein
MTSNNKIKVFTAYRTLLRARDAVFKGDNLMYTNATNEIRTQFRSNAFVSNEMEVQELLQNAFDAAHFLRASIVQGVKEDSGDQYELRLNGDQVKAHIDKTVNINPISEDFIHREERRAKRSVENQK